MTTHERRLKQARACFAASTVLFALFLLLGGPAWDQMTSAGWTQALKIVSQLAGILAWSLMCTAYGLRRTAL